LDNALTYYSAMAEIFKERHEAFPQNVQFKEGDQFLGNFNEVFPQNVKFKKDRSKLPKHTSNKPKPYG
jgi:hypothetical protein